MYLDPNSYPPSSGFKYLEATVLNESEKTSFDELIPEAKIAIEGARFMTQWRLAVKYVY